MVAVRVLTVLVIRSVETQHQPIRFLPGEVVACPEDEVARLEARGAVKRLPEVEYLDSLDWLGERPAVSERDRAEAVAAAAGVSLEEYQSAIELAEKQTADSLSREPLESRPPLPAVRFTLAEILAALDAGALLA